jgi:hypothetical protein
MKSLKQLSTKIYNAVKTYCHRVAELQREAIEFNKEYEKELFKDKK